MCFLDALAARVIQTGEEVYRVSFILYNFLSGEINTKQGANVRYRLSGGISLKERRKEAYRGDNADTIWAPGDMFR